MLELEYYADNIKDTVKDLCRNCFICAKSKKTPTKNHTITAIPIPHKPRLHFAFDIIGGLPNIDGYRYIYIFVDMFSLHIAAFQAKTKTSQELQNAFVAYFALQSAIPAGFTSDNEPGLFTPAFSSFKENFGLTHRHGAPHTPWTNLAENGVKKIKMTLRATVQSTGLPWLEALPLAVIALNSTPVFGVASPANIHYTGTTTDVLHQAADEPRLISDYLAAAQDKAAELNERILKKRTAAASCNRTTANKSRAERAFIIGDTVWLRNMNIAAHRTLQDQHNGPYSIIREYKNSIFGLAPLTDPSEEIRQAHAQHLMKA